MGKNEQDIRKLLASRLREAREYLALTQEEVATSLKLPRSAISLIETGERGVEALELKKFAEVYRRPIEYFTGEVNREPELPSEVVHLARTASKLTAEDREELLRFAKFLQSKPKP
jgi:transcriptional regulator with XRE-family HTH domain